MTIAQIDENFKLNAINRDDVEWQDVEEFSLHGVFYDRERERYARMPYERAEKVSAGVAWLSAYTAGGRVRFRTDSPFVAIKCVQPIGEVARHMPLATTHGFSLYSDGTFCGILAPTAERVASAKDGYFAFEELLPCPEREKEIALFFPLYNGVKKLYIGLQKGCKILPPKEYTYPTPVVFYGSSITQGGCASRPGNDYVSTLSRWLDFEYVNLGFSGNGRAEKEMADYLSELPSKLFVLDYDHNAPNKEYLEQTHYPLYERIRKANPDATILLISKPDVDYDEANLLRRDVVRETFLQGRKQGDKRLYFIDGTTLFGKADRTACTVDKCHPNDLGFFKMAQTILPVLKKLLKKKKAEERENASKKSLKN